MPWIKWPMLVSGGLTATTAYTVISPSAGLELMLGATVEGTVAAMMVRSWAVLVTLIGALLIVGALRPAQRLVALTLAVVSKLAFIALLLVGGFAGNAALTIIVDGLAVLAFSIFLLRQGRPTPA
jgi:hypothetical protein